MLFFHGSLVYKCHALSKVFLSKEKVGQRHPDGSAVADLEILDCFKGKRIMF